MSIKHGTFGFDYSKCYHSHQAFNTNSIPQYKMQSSSTYTSEKNVYSQKSEGFLNTLSKLFKTV